MLDARRRSDDRVSDAAGAPPAFHLLAKPTGALCNLDCKYCFFLSKEMLYPGSRFRMADDLLETYVRQLLESQAGPRGDVAWQGGEPTLMGLDFFRRSVELVDAVPAARASASLHTIQTNGTLLDDEWAASSGEHDFLVGSRASTDRARCTTPTGSTRAASGTFDKVMRGLARARARTASSATC